MRRRLLAAVVLAGIALPAGAAEQGACGLPAGETAIVAGVESAGSLKLDSGETLILSGIEPPSSAPVPDESWPPRAATRAELDRLVTGKAVLIAPGRSRVDRYGNRIGQVYLANSTTADPGWVQGELIAAGLARAAPSESGEPCLADMLTLEAAARLDQRGNWGTGIFADRDAGELYTLRRLHDTFQSVSGVVDRLDHGHGPPALILRSGASKKAAGNATDEGFRVELPDLKGRQNRQTRSADLESLIGRRVRVRGWLEGLRHARIALADRQAIELLEPPAPGAAAAEQK